MKEEYKTCPNCHNMVDKKDKQCPYCLKPLSRRNTPITETNYKGINNEENIELNNEIKNNKSENNFEIPPLFQKIFDLQKDQKVGDKEVRKKIIKYIIIFYILVELIPLIFGSIRSVLGK